MARKPLARGKYPQIPLSAQAKELMRERAGLSEMEKKGMNHRAASALYERFCREAALGGDLVPGTPWKVGV